MKGSIIGITESLTKERYTLYKKCIDRYEREHVWTMDGRIYIATNEVDKNGRSIKICVTREEDLSS